MDSQRQAPWPGQGLAPWTYFHSLTPYELALHNAPYSGCEYLRVPTVVPHYCNTVTANLSAKDNRRFLLDRDVTIVALTSCVPAILVRSVFDLVDAHLYLSLTDPKLLGWYLCLSQEDRKLIQDEGGFHQFLERHPALELSRHHVYVKYNIRGPAKPAMAPQKKPGKKKCSCEEELKKLPGPVREALSVLGCSGDKDEPSSRERPHEKLAQLQDSLQTAWDYQDSLDPSQPKAQKGLSLFELNEDGALWKMTPCSRAAAATSVSVDTKLERCRQEDQPELWGRTETPQGQSANFLYADVSALKSEWSTLEHNSSRYFSFDGVPMDSSQLADSTANQLVEPEKLSCEAAALDQVCTQDGAVEDEDAIFSCGDSNKLFSVMKDDQSILAFLPGGQGRGEEPAESPPPPPVTKRDAMVGTEPVRRKSASTRTEPLGLSDKQMITEVHMADLDYLTEEFIKLKAVKEELKELKERLRSSGCTWMKECECFHRAQQAELGLLALQYNMCRQHCWRLYCSSAEVDQLTQGLKLPPADLSAAVQQLESDFGLMRAEILAGVPLKELKPLSVDCGRTDAGHGYTPAQIVDDVLGTVFQTAGPEKEGADGPSRASSQLKAKEREMKKESSKGKKAVTLLLQEKNVISKTQKPSEETHTAVCKELNSSEAWFDAEEDLQPEDSLHSGPVTAGIQDQDSDCTGPPKTSSSKPRDPERKLVPQPPLGSRSRTAACAPPSEPQYYCTMGSLERLTSELKQRHPEVSRQRIMDALVALRAKHHGVLSGLPLRTIRDMTSELLSSQHGGEETLQ